MYASGVFAKIERGELQRILAFGSSNTQRLFCGMHWFDCLELGLVHRYAGRNHRCINTGIGGHTTADLLARFDEDAAFYKPHLAIITIGGNDCHPDSGIDDAAYRANLLELHRRFSALACAVVFQTYYAFDAPRSDSRIDHFYRTMQIVREVAAESESLLIDHLTRWERLRTDDEAEYRKLMHDPFHVNRFGNMVMGLDLARAFDLPLGQDDPAYWDFPLRTQARMDALEAGT